MSAEAGAASAFAAAAADMTTDRQGSDTELQGGMRMGGGFFFSGSSTRGSSSICPGSGSGDSSRASSYGRASSRCGRAAANYLNSRGIVAVETEYVHDFDSPELCRATYQTFFGLLCPGQHEALFDDSYEALLDVFDQSYSSENKFSEALFKAVGECIQDLAVTKAKQQFKFRSPVLCSDRLLLLAPKERLVIGGTEYAAGLTRETTLPSNDRRPILDDTNDDDDTAPRVHAAVVLRRDACSRRDDGWEVWNVLAVADCTVQGGGVRDLAPNRDGYVDHHRLFPLEARAHRALAPAIMDTVARALRGTAALGGPLPERIPFAVVSGKMEAGGGGCTKARKESNWVHGNVVVPEACGFPYAFNVDAYGNLVDSAHGNFSSVATYLHVMAHGLKLASEWIQHASEAKPPLRKLPAPHWMSGRCLHFGTDTPLTRDGTNEAQLVLAATPVSKYGVSGLRISQGELFKTTVNLHKLQSSVASPEAAFWCRDTYDGEETSVLIKVSSMSCFNLLVPPQSAYLYRIENDVFMLRQDFRDVLSRSLHGVYLPRGQHGLVQLLPNLVEQGYRVLRPKDWLFEDTWSSLWDAFAKLVTGTLLPLARYDILHADLRAGYDVTSNVLYNPSSGGSMRIIDLDSLCYFNSLLGMTITRDKRNFKPDELPAKMRESALGFVLAQVMCVSEAWHGGLRDADVNAPGIIAKAAHSIADVNGGAPATVDEALIANVLAHYRQKMAEKYGSRRRGPDDAAASPWKKDDRPPLGTGEIRV
jgi:hypothetical protein